MSLGERVLQACQLRKVSLAKACAMAGLAYSTLHSQIRNEREIPFTTIDSLSVALGLPVGYFSSSRPSVSVAPSPNATSVQSAAALALSEMMAQQAAAMAELGSQIGTDDVLDWLIRQNHRLTQHEWLIEKVDLFYPVQPGDNMVRPYRIGVESLAAKYFRLLNTDDYIAVVSKFDRPFLDDIVQSHVAVIGRDYSISDREIDLEVDGSRVTGSYRRLMTPVVTEDGQPLTLVFSKLTQFTGR